MAGKDPKEYKKKLRSHGLPKLKDTREKQKDALQNLLQEANVLSDTQVFSRKTYLKDLSAVEAKLKNQAERYEAQHQQVQEMLLEKHQKDATPEEESMTELMADDDDYEPLLYDVRDMLLRIITMREEYRIWAKGSEELDIKEREAEVALKEAEVKKQQELAEAEIKKQQELNDVEVQRQKDLVAKELEQKDQEMQLKDREMKMRETAAAAGTPIIASTSSSNHNASQVKLPKLEMTPFTGDIETWPSFRDTFKSTFERMNDLDKLKYLKSYVRGDAASAVKGFSDVADNFKLAWQKLEKDYGNEEAIRKSHIRAIKKLRLPDISTKSLRQFLNGLETHVERLKALGKNVDDDDSLWDDVETKVTAASVLFFNQLDEKRLQKDNPPKWSMTVLIEILGDFVRKMEHLEQASQNASENVSYGPVESSAQALFAKGRNHNRGNFKNNAKPQNKGKQPGQKPKETQSNQRQGNNNWPCIFCGRNNHKAMDCRTYSTYDARVSRMRELNRCYNCLGSHLKPNCPRPQRLC